MARVRVLRQGIRFFTRTALIGLLAVSLAVAAQSKTIVTIGARQTIVNSEPVSIDGASYVGLDVISALGGSYVSQNSGRSVNVTRRSLPPFTLQATLHKGQTLVSLTQLAKAVDVVARWDEAKKTLRFIPRITAVNYINGQLFIRSNYPLRFAPRDFQALKVFAIDVSPAAIDGQTMVTPIGEKDAIRARTGQFAPDIVRVAIDLAKPMKLNPAAGSKLGEIVLPIAPRPVAVKPSAPVTAPSTPGVKTIQVSGVRAEVVDDAKCKVLISTSGNIATSQPFVLTNPDRVVIDLVGARLAPGVEEEVTVPHPLVDSLRIGQFQSNPDIVRVVAVLTGPATFSIMQGVPTEIAVNIGGGATMPTRHLKGATIVVDPGHGGKKGATSPDKAYSEDDINLAVARRLTDLLQAAGANAVMTRYADTPLGLPERPRLAADLSADLFISLHCNSIGVADKISGTETYYHMNDPVSRQLATCVQEAVIKATGMNDRGPRSDSRVYASGGFSVLRNATVPAVLVELGYLDHWRDRSKLVKPDTQQIFAKGILEGIRTFLEGETIVSSSEEVGIDP